MKIKRTKRIFAALASMLIALTVFLPAAETVSFANVGGVEELIPGGMAFGVKFFTEGAIVLGTTGVETVGGLVSPAKDAGLKAGDIVIRAGGKSFNSAEELVSLIAGSGGKPISVAYLREGKEATVNLAPVREIESGEYRVGLLVRDSTAGIGTVTFIDPNTNDFGGLGHGIYDSDTSQLLPLGRGAIVRVNIVDVVKSERNYPGELKGEFDNASIGELWDNTEQGVFGRFNQSIFNPENAIPVGKKEELSEGKAHILTTLSGDTVEQYEIEIERIYNNSGTTKNFLVRVTDERLLEKTGGIVQGMSGSPIIQEGKLVGAITHVLVNDPTRGYGIFIENMLTSAFDASANTPNLPIAA